MASSDVVIETKLKARDMFIKEGKKIPVIAKNLDLTVNTIYRYRREDADSGYDWEHKRNTYNLSTNNMMEQLTTNFRELLVTTEDDPQKLLEPGVADSLTKLWSLVTKVAPNKRDMGLIIDFRQIFDGYLKEHDPELLKRLQKHWEPLLVEFQKFFGLDGVAV